MNDQCNKDEQNNQTIIDKSADLNQTKDDHNQTIDRLGRSGTGEINNA